MKKKLIRSILPFFLAIVLTHHFILERDWYRSLFAGIFMTIVSTIAMHYFIKWWEKKLRNKKNDYSWQ